LAEKRLAKSGATAAGGEQGLVGPLLPAVALTGFAVAGS